MKSKLILLLLSSLGQKKPRRESSDRGFTLIEVIVAIVILTIFILTSLTALVAGLQNILKAKLNNEATFVIQQNLEQVRSQASYYGETKTITDLPTSPTTGLSTISGTVLPLTIPIANNGQSVSYTGDAQLSIAGENTAFTAATSAQTNPTTSLLVKVDLNKLNSIKTTTLPTSLTLNPPISKVVVTDASNIQVGDRLVIGPATSGTDIFVITVTEVSTATKEVSFAPFTPSAQKTVGTRVSILPRVGDVISKYATLQGFTDCTYANATTTTTIATGFINQYLTPTPTTFSTNFNGRPYQITRKATATSNRIVELEYSVVNTSFSSQPLVDKFKTEVIPSVTFQCSK